jgi:hypothetical protein
MRCAAAEKLEIVRLVEQSSLPVMPAKCSAPQITRPGGGAGSKPAPFIKLGESSCAAGPID